MRRTVNEVALVDVIRPDAAHQQFVHERFHRLEIIVYAGEQDALIAKRNSGIGETLERLLNFKGELARMIHVHAHPKRMMFRENRTKLGRDSLRQENRNARPNPEKLNMLDCAEPSQQFVDLVVTENKRVTAAQKHVAHFGVLLEIMKRLPEIGVELLFPHPTHNARASAIATIRCATIGHQKQNPVWITMHESRNRHV